MDSAQSVVAKRRVLIDALMMCLGKSKVVRVVDGTTVRGVIDSASSELWREGEFRLEPVWKLLIAQPGLSAEEVAPPLLVFKAYEKELGVQVRIPQALSAIPRGEQVRLRDALGIQRADFAKAIEEMHALAGEATAQETQAQVTRQAGASVHDATTAPTKRAKPKKERKALAAVLGAVALIAVIASAWMAMHNDASSYDLADVAGTLQLGNGRRVGGSLTATITDPKWASLSKDEKKRVASAVMDAEAGKGIRSLVLVEAGGKTGAMVDETPEGRVVLVP